MGCGEAMHVESLSRVGNIFSSLRDYIFTSVLGVGKLLRKVQPTSKLHPGPAFLKVCPACHGKWAWLSVQTVPWEQLAYPLCHEGGL